MNMIDIQDKLKNLSEDQLVKEMQAPSGQAPQFLVLSEITRRKKVRDSFTAQQAKQGAPTVAEEVVASAGVPQQGLPQMASAMAPKSSVAQNTGIGSLPVQGMYAGGPVRKMAEGGIVVRNGIRYIQQPDGTLMSEDGTRRLMSAGQDLTRMPSQLAAIPSSLGAAASDMSAGFATGMNNSLSAMGDAAMREQMGEDAYGMRAGPDTSYRYPPMPTVDVSAMDRVGMALEGRTGFSTVPQVDLDLVELNADRAAAMQAGQDASMLGMVAPMGMPPEPGAGRSGFATTNPDAERMDRLRAIMGDLQAERAPQGGAGPSFEQYGREVGNASISDQAAAAAIKNEVADPNQPGFLDAAKGLYDTFIGGMPMVRMQEPPVQPRPDRDQQGGGEAIDGILPPDAPVDATETPQNPPPAMPIVDPAAVVAGGGTGAGGGASNTSGKGGYVSELEAALQRAERTKEQDKWLALAQTGLALMASDQPTLGGAIGEAGQVGIEAFRGARDEYEQSRMTITEAIAAQKAAAAKAAGAGRGSGGGSGLPSLKDYLSGAKTIDEALDMIAPVDEITGTRTMPTDPELARRAARLLNQRDAYISGMLPQSPVEDVRTNG